MTKTETAKTASTLRPLDAPFRVKRTGTTGPWSKAHGRTVR